MRFARIQPSAYGCFAGRSIELPGCTTEQADLHLLFGPNEAGKSTLLAALQDLLFGFPHQSRYAFVHEQSRLRIGASLASPEGDLLHVVRRKGRGHTLFARDPATGQEDSSQPLEESVLAALTGGLDREAHGLLFGLDLEGLNRGGEALLEGRGEVGQSLFQAAAGVAGLKQLRARLEARAEALFSPRMNASKPALNAALAAWRQTGVALREVTVKASDWAAAERLALAAAATHKSARERRSALLESRLHRERIRSSLPLLAKRRSLHEALAELPPSPVLAANASQERIEAERSLREARARVEQLQLELERIAATRQTLAERPAFVALSAEIGRLHQQLAAYRAARQKTHETNVLLGELRLRLEQQTARLGLPFTAAEQLRDLLPDPRQIARVQALARAPQELLGRLDAIREALSSHEARLSRVRGTLTELPRVQAAPGRAQALQRLASLPQQAARAAALRRRTTAAEAALRQHAQRLGCDDVQRLADLAFPERSTLLEFRSTIEQQERRALALAEDERALAEQQDRLAQALAEAVADGEIITEAMLHAARHDRDHGFQAIRQAWLSKPLLQENQTVFLDDGRAAARAEASHWAGSPEASVQAERLAAAISRSDHMADALRADATRAARHAESSQRLAEVVQQRSERVQSLDALARERAVTETAWAQLLAGLASATVGSTMGNMPRTTGERRPAALLEWREEHLRFLDAYRQAMEIRGEGELADAELSTALGLLDHALAESGLAARPADEPLEAALARLEALEVQARALQTERSALVSGSAECEQEIARLRPRQQAAEAALAEWRAAWAEAITPLGLTPECLPAEADPRLEAFANLERVLAEYSVHAAALQVHQATTEEFQSAVRHLAVLLDAAGGPAEADPEARVEGWHELAVEARNASHRHRDLDTEDRQRRAELWAAETVIAASSATLARLCAAAGCDDAAALPAIEARHEARVGLERQLEETNALLVQQSARTVAEVEAEAAEQTAESIAVALTTLSSELDEAEAAETHAHAAALQAHAAFRSIDGGEKAAELQQAREGHAAQVATHAREWSRLRLADTLLERVIGEWRERHQGPLLKRACEVFRLVTCGHFEGLDTEDARNGQVLVGLRPGGTMVPVEGMSQGTRDQLFLALRLAAIEAHVTARGPCPVIADDLLVQFDDDRALAGLRVLLELARHTQVLVLTHHRHLLALAEQAGLTGKLHVQTL